MGKIKEDIIRLIDGELSADESSRVMEEINQSPELESFYKAAKQSTSALQSYFGSEEVKEAIVRIEDFVDSKVKENQDATVPDKTGSVFTKLINYIVSTIKFIFKYFFLAPLAVGAAAVILFFMVSIPFNIYDKNNFGYFAPNVYITSQFTDASKDFVIPQYRSARDPSNFIEKELEKIIKNLIDSKITTATITIDDVAIELQLLKYDGSCYFGDISQDMSEIQKFKYCFVEYDYDSSWYLAFKSRKNFIQKMLNSE